MFKNDTPKIQQASWQPAEAAFPTRLRCSTDVERISVGLASSLAVLLPLFSVPDA